MTNCLIISALRFTAFAAGGIAHVAANRIALPAPGGITHIADPAFKENKASEA